ncbi:hypothetical protein [Sporosarcina sp. P17b]|uniref:DUF7336 domain-containing protein n=1 Tax=Sporosarcina sp. P17b TaxID=2048260 RepID=UPI000C16E6D6|nr:hypothetical protein [Sporosarcina sp. P17b]PIC72507.1 hypothetical protein CSV76_14855 [Sporosarcina sp. P17b]
MKLYVLYTSYPYEGGYVHGVFSTREQAQQALDSDDFDFGHSETYIQEVAKDNFIFQQIEI